MVKPSFHAAINFLQMHKRYVLFFILLGLFVLFLRRPDALLNAQFWAEDGTVWFADAYAMGIRSLLTTQDGYFQTLPRLASLISMPLDFRYAPLIFNAVALLVQILPVGLLLSSSAERLAPLRARWLLAFIYLLLPNTAEVQGNVTNSQWYLALAACLVLFVETDSWTLKIRDGLILTLSGLSGPFSILLSPIAVWQYLRERSSNAMWKAMVIVCAAVVQTSALFWLSHAIRVPNSLDSDPRLPLAVFGRQVVVSGLIGSTGYSWALNNLPQFTLVVAGLSCVFLALVIHAVFNGNRALRGFIAFACFIFVAGLVSPSGDFSQYSPLRLLSRSTDGVRYWLIPMLCMAACLVWGTRRGNPRWVRILAFVFLTLGTIGVVADFRYPKRIDYGFSSYVRTFEMLEPGHPLSIPINPEGWSMTLIKR